MPDLNFQPAKDKDHVLQMAKWEIEHEDVLHLKNLYKLAHNWLMTHNFLSIDSNDDKIETMYFEKVLGNGNKEHHIWWRTHHIPDGSKYFKYYLKLDFQTLNMGKKETTYKGKKLKSNFGDVIMRCESYLMIDYQKKWRKHPIMKYLYKYFLIYFYKDQIEYYKTDLWIKTYKLQDVIKQYLNLKTPEQMPEYFYDQMTPP
ncbi:hypothetical protein KO361_01990 [Candidatus Woesearchaeota archaeon]|nr:hypothetical protein [Candidatus Woesearchaeota archaeon]